VAVINILLSKGAQHFLDDPYSQILTICFLHGIHTSVPFLYKSMIALDDP
jgi:hypothetical protein